MNGGKIDHRLQSWARRYYHVGPLGPTPYSKSLTGLILSRALKHVHPADRRLIAQVQMHEL